MMRASSLLHRLSPSRFLLLAAALLALAVFLAQDGLPVAQASHTLPTPTNVQVTVTGTTATVIWNAVTGGGASVRYRVEYGEHPSGSTSTTATNAVFDIISGLTGGQDYRFRVRAYDNGAVHTQSAYSDWVTATTPTVLISNTGQTSHSNRLGTNNIVWSSSFTTGSETGGYRLGGVELNIQGNPTSAQRDTIKAELWSDSSGPSAKLYDLTVPAHPIQPGTVFFAAPANTTLTASTTYWVVPYTTGSFNLALDAAAGDGENSGGASGWSIGNASRFRQNSNTPGGGTWGTQSGATPVLKMSVIQAQQTAGATDLSALTAEGSTDGSTFTALSGANALAPAFAAGTTSYRATVGNDVTHVKLTPTVADGDSTVKVGKAGTTLADVTSGSPSGAIALDVGDNEITVEVTASDSSTQDYTVTVRRVTSGSVWHATLVPAKRSSDGALGCWEDLTDTSVRCGNTAALTDNSFTVGGSSHEVIQIITGGGTLVFGHGGVNPALQSLNFCFGTTSSALSGSTITHRWTNTGITWTAGTPVSVSIGTSCAQQTTQSTNANLSGLTASGSSSASGTFSAFALSPAFDKDTLSYSASVANSVTHAKLTPTVDDSKATVRVGKVGSLATVVSSGLASGAIALDVGDNDLVVQVTAEDTTNTKTYTVTITQGAAPGSFLVSNTGQANDGTVTTNAFSYAQAFTTGSESGGYTLGSIDFVVEATNITETQRDTIRAELWSAATGGAPNAKVADLTVPAHPISTDTVNFTAPASTTLSAGTTYYAVVYTVGAFTIDPTYTNSDNEDTGGATNWSIADGVRHASGNVPTSTSTWSAPETFAVRIRVKGTVGQQTQSTNANLSGLTASSAASAGGTYSPVALSPAFSASTTAYTGTVANARTHAKLTPTTADSNATVTVNGTQVTSGSASGAIALDVGTNALTVRVTAQDTTTTKTYTVTITRQSAAAVPTVKLSASPNPVVEGQSVAIIATLSETLNSSVTIPVTINDIDAEPADHGTLTGIDIAANALSGSGTIQTNHDTGDGDADETFTVALGTLPASVAAGSPSQVTVTILDDEAIPTVRLAVSGCGDAAGRLPTGVTECVVAEGEGVGLRAVLSRSHRKDLTLPVLLRWGREYKNGMVVDYGDADQGDLDRRGRRSTTKDPNTGTTYSLYTLPTIISINGGSHGRIDGIKNMRTNRDADDQDDSFTATLLTGGSDWPESVLPPWPSSVAAGSPSSLTITMRDADRKKVDGRPGAPRYLDVRAGDASLDLKWKAPLTENTATGYDVHYTSLMAAGNNARAGSDPERGWVAVERSGREPSQAITGLSNDTPHRVRVRSTNPAGSSAWVFGNGTPTAPQDSEPAPMLLEYIQVHYDGDPPVDDFFHHAAATLASYGYRARIPDEFVSRDPDRQGVVLTTHAKLKIHPANAGTTLKVGKVTYDANGNRNVTLTAVTAGQLSHAIELNAHSPNTFVDIEATHDGVTRTYLLAIDPPPRTYSLSPSARVVEGQEAALTLNLSRPAPEGGVEFTVTASYGSAGSEDVGDIASPVTVPQDGTALQILVPTVDDGHVEQEESFRVTVAPVRAGWAVAPVGTDTATVTIEDNDAAGQQGGDEDEDDKYAELIAQMYEWRNDPQWKEYKAHTDRWDRALLAFGETVADQTLTPMTAAEAQGFADRGWTRWVPVAKALRELQNRAPTVASAIADAAIVNESGTRQVSLSGVFSDADNDALTVTAASSDETKATVSVSAGYSSLMVSAQARGTATITVTADDGYGGTADDTFTVTIKAAPVVASALADVSALVAGDAQDVSLSGVFSDADGDALTVTADSSDDAIATVSVSADGSKLTLTGVAEGTARITVTAQDVDGNRVSDEFSVTVAAPPQQQPPSNRAPTVASAIADATIVSESGTKDVSLSGTFSDADGDSLTITASSSNDAVATVSVAAGYSSLTVNARSRGTAAITVTAADGNGGTVTDTFAIRVKAAPVVASAISNLSGLVTGATQDVSLSGVFSDADGDALTITANSSDNAKATVTVSTNGSKLTLAGVAEGVATITVTARDSDGNTVSDTFDVSVEPEPEQDPPPDEETPNRPPTVVSPLPDISLEGPEQREFDLSAVFHDPDGDELTFSAVSSNYGVATTLHVNGTTLTVVATGTGTATITVTAEDPDGNQVSDAFEVTVRPLS